MRYSILVWMLAGVLYSCQSRAAVRYVDASERAITPIHLSLGRSTVLRFREKPKKVVIGNQNYFNVEFIESDLAIQPLGVVSTNLFVYGEFHTYGLSLQVGGPQFYDDLVHVSWQAPVVAQPMAMPRVKPQIRKVGKKFSIGKSLRIQMENLVYLSDKNLVWIECLLTPTGLTDVKDIAIKVFENGKKEVASRLVCKEATLKPEQSAPCRIFFPAANIKSRTLKVTYHDAHERVNF